MAVWSRMFIALPRRPSSIRCDVESFYQRESTSLLIQSVHVLELRIEVAELSLLVVGEADVAHGPGAAAVLHHNRDEVERAGYDAEDGEGNGDSVAFGEEGRIGLHE